MYEYYYVYDYVLNICVIRVKLIVIILIVDNNSPYLEDIENILKKYINLKIIINNSKCKFEIGAYNEGIRYIQNNNLLNNYEYFIFSQDNFVLKSHSSRHREYYNES